MTDKSLFSYFLIHRPIHVGLLSALFAVIVYFFGGDYFTKDFAVLMFCMSPCIILIGYFNKAVCKFFSIGPYKSFVKKTKRVERKMKTDASILSKFDQKFELDSLDLSIKKEVYGLIAETLFTYIEKLIKAYPSSNNKLVFYTHATGAFEEMAKSLDEAKILKPVRQGSPYYLNITNDKKPYNIATNAYSDENFKMMLSAFLYYLMHEGLVTSTRKEFKVSNQLENTFKLLEKMHFVKGKEGTYIWLDKMAYFFQSMFEWDNDLQSIADKKTHNLKNALRQIPGELLNEVKRLKKQNQKIYAIQVLREKLNISLKEAMDMYDRI